MKLPFGTATRRGLIAQLLGVLLLPKVVRAGLADTESPLPKPDLPTPTETGETYTKVVWKQLTDEPLTPGDMWASRDPNDPERQWDMDCRCNLMLTTLHPSNYGVPASKVPLGNGAHWRPVGITQVPYLPPTRRKYPHLLHMIE